MTGVPQSMATKSSEGIGKEGEVMELPCMPGRLLIVLRLMIVRVELSVYG